jgi:AcrR family transcriptional regulator
MLSKEKTNEIYLLSERLIQENGIVKMNISELCSSVSISKKTFYRNFGSKKNFIEKFYMNMLKNAYIEVISIIQAKNSFFDKFENISQIVENRIPFFNNNSFQLLKNKYPEVAVNINYFKNNKIIPLLTLLIEKAQQRKIINDYNPGIMINVFFGAISSIYYSQFSLIKSEKNEIKFREVFEILLRGILTKKGKSFLNQKLVNIN